MQCLKLLFAYYVATGPVLGISEKYIGDQFYNKSLYYFWPSLSVLRC